MAVDPNYVYPAYAPATGGMTWWDLVPRWNDPFHFWTKHVELAHGNQAGWDWSPEATWDLMFAFYFAVMWFCLRHCCKFYIFPHVAKLMGMKGRTRTGKFSYQSWLFFYYTGSSIVGYFVIRDESYHQYPVTAISGADLFNYHPWPLVPKIQWLYYYQIGFYVAELFAIFLEPKRKDFFEYLLHHLVTIGLTTGSYVSNHQRIGIYITFIHDIPDIFLCGAKCLHYAKKPEWIINSFFVVFVSTFAFFRLYCLPHLTWIAFIIAPNVKRAGYSHWVLSAMFGIILQLLHVFWFYLIIRMIVRLINGVNGDMRSDESDTDADGSKSKNPRVKGDRKKKEKAATEPLQEEEKKKED